MSAADPASGGLGFASIEVTFHLGWKVCPRGLRSGMIEALDKPGLLNGDTWTRTKDLILIRSAKDHP